MAEPAYVRLAGDYAQRIRSGVLPPRTQLPSYTDIAREHGVSDIVVRKALELLQSQGLVRAVRRRGVFVADRPAALRVSPEHQMESAEQSFQNEPDGQIDVDRVPQRVPAAEEIAKILGVAVGEEITHVVTRAAENGRPISISDTWTPSDVADISEASFLEETIADRIPPPTHAEWLSLRPGDLVKSVHQRFISADNRIIMVCDISYPRDRYDAFVFRMSLK